MIRVRLFGTPIKIIAGDRKTGWARIRYKDGSQPDNNASIFWELSEDTEGEIDYVLSRVPDYSE